MIYRILYDIYDTIGYYMIYRILYDIYDTIGYYRILYDI